MSYEYLDTSREEREIRIDREDERFIAQYGELKEEEQSDEKHD